MSQTLKRPDAAREPAPEPDAHVAHDPVQTAQRLQRAPDDLRAVVFGSDVADERLAASAFGCDQPNGLVGRGPVDVRARDRRAFSRRQYGDLIRFGKNRRIQPGRDFAGGGWNGIWRS